MSKTGSILSLLTGLTLLTAAFAHGALGSGTAEKVLRLNVSETAVSYVDPALNYDFIGWRIEAATCARLLSYPDKAGVAGSRLIPEVAAGFPLVSQGGKAYTFRVRSSYRFSTGETATAEGFAWAINRALQPKMQSPAASFLHDVQGAARVLAGKAKTASGVTVKGNTLTVRLTQVAPDFLARIAMPFFCAIPPDLPLDPKGVRLPPGSGPYTITENVPNREILLRRNPYYRGPRPVRWDAMRFSMNTNRNASYLQVRKGEADMDLVGIPPAANAQLTRELGINRGRYFVHPAQWITYIALNTARPFFADVATRQAVNYAVDRKALNRLAGLNSGTPNDQVLVPGIPGYKEVTVYPNRPNVAKAKALLAGKTGTIVLYTGNDPISQSQAQLLQQDLGRVGITVKPELYSFAVQIEKAGRRGAPFDMNSIGWIADYPDPYDFINILLDGTRISESNNVNTAYFDDPKYNAKMHAAARLSGDARYRVYGALDIDITRNAAPLAVVGDANVREFISSKVGCGVYSSVQGGLNIVLLCPRK